jgi:hypothetical protein
MAIFMNAAEHRMNKMKPREESYLRFTIYEPKKILRTAQMAA